MPNLTSRHRTIAAGFSAIFVHANQQSDEIIEKAMAGAFRVVFVCAEMLESPTFAVVLNSPHFQALLTGIYLDEAHLVHESRAWRSSYTRLGQARSIVGMDVPLVAISATLPSTYRLLLCEFARLKKDYSLINLGNHRPELTTVVVKLQHDVSSFNSPHSSAYPCWVASAAPYTHHYHHLLVALHLS